MINSKEYAVVSLTAEGSDGGRITCKEWIDLSTGLTHKSDCDARLSNMVVKMTSQVFISEKLALQ